MADFSRALYDEVVEHNIYYANSTNALLELEENQYDVLVEIRDIIKDFKNQKAVRGTKKTDVDSGGASVKGMFGKIGDLFKAELMSVFKEFNKMFGDISGIKKAPTLEFTNFLRDFMNAITLDGKYDNPRELAELYKTVSDGFAKIGEAIMPMSKGLLVFAIAEKLKIPTKFIEFIQDLFSKDTLKKIDTKRANELGLALQSIGIGIFKFALYMALTLPLMLIAAPAALIIVPFVVMLLGVMSLVSKRSKTIKRGAKALRNISLAFLLFAGSLAIISMLGNIDYPKVLGVIGMFLAFTAVITVISMIGGKDMRKAAISVGILSVSLIAFGLALMLFDDVGWEAIAKAGVSLALLTGVSLLLGINMGGTIVAALSILLMVGAVAALAYVIPKFDEIEWESIAKVGVVLVTLAGIAILLGFFGPISIVGAIAFAIIALSFSAGLYLISGAFENMIDSLDKFKKMGWTVEDSENLGMVFKSIITNIIEPFQSDSLLEGIGNLVGGVVGGGMMVAISLTIDDLVDAIDKFKKSGITAKDGENIGETIAAIITAIKKPIMEIGTTTKDYGGGKSGKLMTYFSEPAFENGMEALKGVGTLISELAIGVQLMSNLTFTNPETGEIRTLTTVDFDNAGKNIKSLFNAMKDPIIEIGSATKDYGGGRSGKLMTYFSEPAFENGMEAAKGVGKFLIDMAEGVQKMSNLTFVDPLTGKERTLTTTDFTNAGNNVKALFDAMKIPIIEIGKDTKEYEGYFGNVMTYFSEPAFENGMEAAKGVGSFLTDMANAVMNMSKHKYFDKDGNEIDTSKAYQAAGDNIKLLFDAMKVPIIEIGSKTVQHKGYFGNIMTYFSEPAFAKGMDAAKGVGSFLIDITNAVMNMSKNKFTDADGNIVDPSTVYDKVGDNITKLITSIKQPIIDLGEFGDDFKDNIDVSVNVGTMLSTLNSEVSKLMDSSMGTSIVNKEEFHLSMATFTGMVSGLTALGNNSSNIVKSTSSITKMNISTKDLFIQINKTTVDKIEKTRLLFESLVKLDTYSSKVFEDKLEAVEDLIEKTSEISSKVKDFGKAIIPKASEETKQMVALLESMALKQDSLETAIISIDTTLKNSILKVEQQ